MLLGLYSALVNQPPLHWSHLGCLNSYSAVNTPSPLTVFRDDYFHWLTEGSNAPFSDGRNSHCAGGIVGLDRNLSPAAILADFFRKFFLKTKKQKGNETLMDSGRWLTRQLPTLPTVPSEGSHPCSMHRGHVSTKFLLHRVIASGSTGWVRELGVGAATFSSLGKLRS